jgi:hypothetical protein
MQATYHDMTPAIGQKVVVRFEEIGVSCQVVNVKSSYGRIRLLVSPELGNGEQWVELSRVRPRSNETAIVAR